MFWIKEETIWFTENYTDSSERVIDKRNATVMLRQLEHVSISSSGCQQLWRLHKELTVISESLKIILKNKTCLRGIKKQKQNIKYKSDLRIETSNPRYGLV